MCVALFSAALLWRAVINVAVHGCALLCHTFIVLLCVAVTVTSLATEPQLYIVYTHRHLMLVYECELRLCARLCVRYTFADKLFSV